MGTLRIAFLSGSILELAATLGIALVAVVVGVRLAEGGIGFEAALTVLVLVPELYLPLRNLAAQFHASADGAAVAERLLELAEPAQPRARGTAPPDPTLVPIRFEGVSFAYPSRDLDVLRGLDLEIRPGETTSIVGPSGVGKSTLVSLLLRLADPSSGRIVVGDDDLALLDATRWRALTALVPQQPTLFRATVAENIRLGAPAADENAYAAPPSSPARTTSSRGCRCPTPRSSGTAGGSCRPVSGDASLWRARSCATLRSSCSTSRRRISTQ